MKRWTDALIRQTDYLSASVSYEPAILRFYSYTC